MTTATIPAQPVAVEELRRAWLAVQAGAFRHPATRPPAPPAPQAAAPAGPTASVWTPASGERVLPVVGAAGSSGATTVALALATSAGGRARVVECCTASHSGLVAASTAELGADDVGWLHGSRYLVLLDRADGPRPTLDAVPAPPPAEAPLLTIVDVGHQLEQILAGSGWLSGLLTGGPMVVLVARATVPGLRRLESSLHLLAGVPVAAVVGPPLRRWPRPVRSSVCRLTGSLIESGRLVQVPEDRQLAALGITPRPLPGPLLGAAGSLFALAEGTPDAR